MINSKIHYHDKGGMAMEKFMKNGLLYLSKNKTVNHLAKKYGLRFGAQRFVAGDNINDAISAVQYLNSKGIIATLDHLGEFVSTKEEALLSTEACIATLEAIHVHQLQANLSLKMTQLGLDISSEFCLENMRTILNKASAYHIFVRIDMEDYTRNEMTLDIFRTLKTEYEEVGVVIQAYLYKSLDDIKALHALKPNLRICKGAYKESSDVAFPEKKDVDENYIQLVKHHLSHGNYAGIATHDEHMIERMKEYIHQHQIPHDQFEFQMLYGIRTDLQEKLAEEGYRVRAYVPYGVDWYGYFMRRLAERPANVSFVIRNFFK